MQTFRIGSKIAEFKVSKYLSILILDYTTAGHDMMGAILGLTKLWWLRLPIMLSRISNNLSIIFVDGIYTVRWQRLSAFLPIIVFIFGVITGIERFDGEELFTQSFVILLMAIIFGSFGSQFGIMFILGFIISDLFIYENPGFRFTTTIEEQLKLHFAQLITYVGLVMISILIPFFARIFALQIPYSLSGSLKTRLLVNISISATSCFILISIFIQSLAVLIRPFYVWIGNLPPVSSVFPVQEQGSIFAIAGALIISIRIVIEQIPTASKPELMVNFLEKIQQKQIEINAIKIPKIARIFLFSGISTFLVSGLLGSQSDYYMVFAALLAIGLLRWSLTKFVSRFVLIMEKIPLILRLSVSLIISVLISVYTLEGNLYGTSFQPIINSLLLSLVCMAVIFPEPSENFRKKMRQ